MRDDFKLCADSSREVGESLAGTASPYRVFMLLEYRPNWHPKATKPGRSGINVGLQTYIHEALDAAGGARLVFIRQLGRQEGPLRCFFAFPDALVPRVYGLSLKRYEDILQYSLADMLAGQVSEDYAHDEPLYAVCAHKERDRACGAYGWGVYNALRELVGGQAWQSTHLGGHRFAGTLLAFPRGTHYGHMELDDVAQMVEAEEGGQMYLPKVRGRACYAKPVQAAEAELREKLGLAEYNALRLKQMSETGKKAWRVTFADRAGAVYSVDVRRETSDYAVVKSTGEAPTRVDVYKAVIVEG